MGDCPDIGEIINLTTPLPRQTQEILPVLVLFHALSDGKHLRRADEASSPRNLLHAGNLQSLPGLDRLDIVAGLLEGGESFKF
jgi:hypothetical protein